MDTTSIPLLKAMKEKFNIFSNSIFTQKVA